jgi:pimeloyl-ACP methyl ester carboxylesterase
MNKIDFLFNIFDFSFNFIYLCRNINQTMQTVMRNTILIILGVMAVFSARAAEREISIDRPWGQLHGTLAQPDAGSDVAAVIIAGSGPTDRNGNSPLGISTDCYLMLARAFERQGIASLRYDKQGIGASRYTNPGFSHEKVRFRDFIEDAGACAAWLKEAGFKRVVLVGHSEGSLIALVAASETPAVDGVVSISGAGLPIGRILMTQLKAQLADYKPEMIPTTEAIVSRLEEGREVPPSDVPQELRALFNPSVQPFLISQMRYDPREVIRTVAQPVLVVSGDNDIQVAPDNARMLADAQPRAEVCIIEGMTHVLKQSAETDRQKQAMTVYTNRELPLSEKLVDVAVAFVKKLK